MPLPQSPGEKTNDNIYNNLTINQAVMLNKLSNVEEKVEYIRKKLESKYVTQESFEPVKKVVYGLVGLILVAVFGALITLVVQK